MQFATPVWAVKQKEMGKANSTPMVDVPTFF
jgi:hypothetical protein